MQGVSPGGGYGGIRRREINAVGGYYAFGRELMNGNSVFDFDTTKLSVHTLDIGLAGIEVYDILRDEYDIQIEFGRHRQHFGLSFHG